MSDQKKQRHYDDLTQIKGIGQSTQQWLRETFDIYEYPDLARLSPAELEQKLKADGKIASRTRIEHWLTQAAELAAAKPIPKHIPEHEAQQTTPWKRVATFVVVFEEDTTQVGKYQTNVHHMETDVTHTWEHIEKHELGNWIIQQLDTETGTLVESSAEKSLLDPIPPAPQLTEIAEFPTAEVSQSDKLQHYIAKAQAMSRQPGQMPVIPQTAPQPIPVHPTQAPMTLQTVAQPMPVQPIPELSPGDKLQRYIAKAQALSVQPEQSAVKQPTPQPTVPPPAPVEQHPEQTSYSDKLQRYIDKANALAARHSG